LNAVMPIKTDNSKSFLERFPGVLGLLTAGLMVIVYISTNKLLVGVSGLLLTIFLTWALLKLWANKNLDNKSKGRLWVALIVLASVIAVTILKLTNNFSV
jgi:hypothetical protein